MNAHKSTDRLAREVEDKYQRDFVHPFPYQACYRIQRLKPRLTRGLVPDLDTFFSFIAGYSSSATHLRNRTKDELARAIPKLKRSFYEAYPRYESLEEFIARPENEALQHDLRVADQLRSALVVLMEQLV
jgi:hypothetical protein